MLYVSYVALVAVLNVVIGFKLAEVFLDPSTRLTNQAAPQLHEVEESEPSGDLSLIVDTPDVAGVDSTSAPTPMDQAATNKRREIETDGSWAGIVTLALDNSEKLQTTLQSIFTRIGSGTPAPTADELQQLAQLALNSAATWLADAEYVGSHLSISLKDMPDGKTVADRCERLLNEQLAQTETSMSNLSMIDWRTDAADASAARLVHELTRLIESSSDLQSKLRNLTEFVYMSRNNFK